MAKFVTPQAKYHRVRLRADHNRGELLLVGRGRNAYLWAGPDGSACVTFSGSKTLRRLARAILKHVPVRRV